MNSLEFYSTLESSDEGKLYLSLIQKVQSENRTPKERNDGFEVHHIFPYTWSLDSSEENTVKLTVPEHIKAHYYLARVFGGPMHYAFHILTGRTVKHLDQLTLEELEHALPYWTETRKAAAHRKHSPEEHEKMRIVQKEIHSREDYREKLRKNGCHFKKGYTPWNKGMKLSDEIRANMSKAMKGKKHVCTEEHHQKIAALNRAKAQDPEYRKKLSLAQKGRKKIYFDQEDGTVKVSYAQEQNFSKFSGWYLKVYDKALKSYQRKYLS